MQRCENCQTVIGDLEEPFLWNNRVVCAACRERLERSPQQPAVIGYATPQIESKRVLCGVLALVIGGFGVHKFVLGYIGTGVLHLLISIVTCGFVGGIIALIEGIIYLAKTDAEFVETYQVGRRPWF